MGIFIVHRYRIEVPWWGRPTTFAWREKIVADDLRLAQLLSSRLCHDLAGPAGAVANGLELLGEAVDDQAIRALLAASSLRLGRCLALQRAAFGLSGGRLEMPAAEARALALDYVAGSKLTLDWPAVAAGDVVTAQFGRLLLCVVLLAVGALPRGGHIRLEHAGALGPGGILCEAAGRDAALPETVRVALDPTVPVGAVSAPAAYACYAGRLAKALDLGLSVELPAADRVRILVRAPSAA